MVTSTAGLIFFIIWLVIGILSAILVVRGGQVPKGTFFCALIIVLMYYFEKAFGV
jgi:hypothetical protein